MGFPAMSRWADTGTEEGRALEWRINGGRLQRPVCFEASVRESPPSPQALCASHPHLPGCRLSQPLGSGQWKLSSFSKLTSQGLHPGTTRGVKISLTTVHRSVHTRPSCWWDKALKTPQFPSGGRPQSHCPDRTSSCHARVPAFLRFIVVIHFSIVLREKGKEEGGKERRKEGKSKERKRKEGRGGGREAGSRDGDRYCGRL